MSDLGLDLGMGEARRRVLTRVFGVPRDKQSFLVTAILVGAGATVLRGLAPRRPRLSGSDAAIGSSVLNATLRGVAGAPSRNLPLAGALIAIGSAVALDWPRGRRISSRGRRTGAQITGGVRGQVRALIRTICRRHGAWLAVRMTMTD
jgi:hypothetical protein